MTVVPMAHQRLGKLVGDESRSGSLAALADGNKLRSVVLGGSKDPNAKITILLVDDRRHVRFVVKLPTTERAAEAVAREARMLRELAEKAPHLSRTLPRELGTVDFEGRAGLVMSPVAGAPLLTLYARRGRNADPRSVAGDFSAAARWLADLQCTTTVDRAALDMDAGIATRLEERFADDHRISRDLELLAAINARLVRNAVPRTVVHGDFWFGNLLVADGAVSGVVDWEAGEVCGEPARDLVRFALMYSMFLDRGTKVGRRVAGHRQLRAGVWGAGVDYALNGTGWFPDLIREFLTAGLARLGAAPECWREAALAGVAEVAALTDEPEFARSNLTLFRRLASQAPRARSTEALQP